MSSWVLSIFITLVATLVGCSGQVPPQPNSPTTTGPAATEPAVDADGDELVADDDWLYSCRKIRGKLRVSFQPGVTLEDLVAWAMGFTCKNIVFESDLAGSEVTIVAPTALIAAQAWQLFRASSGNDECL